MAHLIGSYFLPKVAKYHFTFELKAKQEYDHLITSQQREISRITKVEHALKILKCYANCLALTSNCLFNSVALSITKVECTLEVFRCCTYHLVLTSIWSIV